MSANMETKKVFKMIHLISVGQRSEQGDRRVAHSMAPEAIIRSTNAAAILMETTDADLKEDP